MYNLKVDNTVSQLHFSRIFLNFTVITPALKGEVRINCDVPASVAVNNVRLSVLKRGPFPSLSYGFMQKMKEEEVEWVYMRELESL